MTENSYYPATTRLPEKVKAACLVKYQEPHSMPPIIKAIPQGTVFESTLLSTDDIRAMLRQGTIIAADGGAIVDLTHSEAD